ncbi:N-acetylmuramoyl-L-alanine amidase [Halanaerobium saccharolyticum]|uniref:N-acetylmuramoyl-L-alanine amidase n=1 Tax=Halanaerobium saccharolyticum TaxID=43595 RepID=A0A4R7Z4A7_9FIRM|nr:N-acetylmuramoyl-L-alanine amidase [Halanaerobium saccharolyticum]TDW02637.1 N-acetylmuramoyl-L-alanine amidase [Halanaerobium saccharolyticum]TDX60732.1 N-acetylmuramoyl-L-alanine amidase [Halanaerobium saccharolyticum]
MSVLRKLATIILVTIILSLILTNNAAAQNTIYFNGQDITSQIETVSREGELLIRARDLAELLDADLTWRPALKSLEMESQSVTIKIMANSRYIQIENDAIRTEAGLQLVDNQAYIPLAKSIEAFGYLLEYQRDNEELYIFQPETTINNVSWQEDGNQLQIEMDEITPYRVLHSEDGREITIEIDKAEIDQEFSDNISNNNYYLRVVNVPDRALLRLVIKSRTPIPFQIDGGVYEHEDSLVLSFLPQLKDIRLNEDNLLSVEATGEIPDARTKYLSESRKMIIDIPSVVIGNFDLDIEEHPLIKDIKVTQHDLDPVILRIEATMANGDIFKPVQREKSNLLTFKPGQRSEITDLEYAAGSFSFASSSALNPELFLLESPPRLVMNLYHVNRGSGIQDKIEVNNPQITSLRTARFDDQTVRIVADLEELTGYEWVEEQKNGLYYYTVNLKNKFSEIKTEDNADYQYLNILMDSRANYEVKKFNYPHRIVVDFKNTLNNLDDFSRIEKSSLIKDIRSSNYQLEGEEVTRLVFELNDYYSHRVESYQDQKGIKIALAKEYLNPEMKAEKIVKSQLIVIDAGHGGFDPGAIGATGLEEKVSNLAIAKATAKQLSKTNHKVLLTRDSDEFHSLQNRVKYANDRKADIFVSIHANSFNNPQTGGVETYYNQHESNQNRFLAEKIHDKLGRGLKINDRGIKESNFYVIKYTKMPSALVEVAFLSNAVEENMLRTKSFQDRAAALIADGILDYLEENGGE